MPPKVGVRESAVSAAQRAQAAPAPARMATTEPRPMIDPASSIPPPSCSCWWPGAAQTDSSDTAYGRGSKGSPKPKEILHHGLRCLPQIHATVGDRLAGGQAVPAPAAWPRPRHLPVTRGRITFSAWVTGLPVLLLTTKGARTGEPRAARVLGIPDGDGFIIVAANFGQRVNPAWYYNLRAHPRVSVVARDAEGTYYARELSGAERERGFQRALSRNPRWQRFRSAWRHDRVEHRRHHLPGRNRRDGLPGLHQPANPALR